MCRSAKVAKNAPPDQSETSESAFSKSPSRKGTSRLICVLAFSYSGHRFLAAQKIQRIGELEIFVFFARCRFDHGLVLFLRRFAGEVTRQLCLAGAQQLGAVIV